MRRMLLAAAATVVVTSLSPAAVAETGGVTIKSLDTATFPEISLIVESSETRADEISLLENGDDVADLNVTPLTRSGGSVDVVLVIDTSGSMVGEPFQAAVQAARRFISKLPDEISVGVVSFADRPKVISPISADHDAVRDTLGSLRPDGETALYDGLKEAAGLFTSDGQHNIVVLSDGGDTVSGGTLQAAARAATQAKATIRTVGLRSGDFDANALRSLSRLTKGKYESVATANLEDLYQDVAEEIASQFQVTYTSEAPRASDAQIVVRAPAGFDTTIYLTAEASEKPTDPGPPAIDPPSGPVLTGTAGLAIALGLTFLAAFIFGTTTVSARARNRRDRRLASRMGVVASEPEIASSQPSNSAAPGWIPDSFVEVAGRVANRGSFGEKVDRKLERASIAMSPPEFFAIVALTGIGGGLFGLLLFQHALMAIVVAGIAGGAPFAALSIAVSRRLKRLHTQLADVLMILASSLRAGHSFVQALDAVAQEAGEPATGEFSRAVAEVRLGRSLTEALEDLADRVDSDDFRWAILAVTIQREVGGNLAEVLDTVAATMRERDVVRRQVDVLSAEGKLSIYVLTALPVILAVYMGVVNPKYLSLLWTTRIGIVMLVTGSAALAVGVAWMRKVVKISV